MGLRIGDKRLLHHIGIGSLQACLKAGIGRGTKWKYQSLRLRQAIEIAPIKYPECQNGYV